MERNRTGQRLKNAIVFTLFLILIAAGIAAYQYSGKDLISRIKYQLSGNEEVWNEAAIELNLESKVEEYYYNNLPADYHEAYREIYVRLMRYEDSSEIMSSVKVNEFWKIYYAVLADHPEIFWIGSSAQIEESGLTGNVVTYNLEVTVPTEQRAEMKQKLEAAADACIGQIPDTASDYERIKFVYEYIIDTTDYDINAEDSQNIQSALLNHSSVCAGYSKSFQYILNRMGLFCTYITGKIKDGGDHGWNMVRIDGKYYYVDVTWGDPIFAGQMEHESFEKAKNYNYLCCSEMDLFKTHIPSDSIPLPSCTSDDYNYYVLNGLYYETFDYDQIHEVLMNSVWNGDASISLKFGSKEAFDEACYAMFEMEDGLLREPGEYLMNINGVKTWNYKYHTDPVFNLITIYWT